MTAHTAIEQGTVIVDDTQHDMTRVLLPRSRVQIGCVIKHAPSISGFAAFHSDTVPTNTTRIGSFSTKDSAVVAVVNHYLRSQ